MGVHGLWQLLHPAGRPVTLESLEGKVLAVDVSLWLHQTMKGMRDKHGNPLPNAHLQGLFSRVCKLLFYCIKPVFVFDGDAPALKKQTLIARREKKNQAERESQEVAQKLLRNLVKSEAVKNALAESSSSPVKVPGVKKGSGYHGDRDIFELAPLHESEDTRLKLNAVAWDKQFEQQETWIRAGLSVLTDVKHGSEQFKMLPIEIQHEVLSDLKEKQKYHSLRQMTQMPEDSDNFSAYQLKKLMKLCNLTTEIESVRKRMTNKIVNDIELETQEEFVGDEVEARRIVSEDASHYVLVKGISKEKQREQADRFALQSKIKQEKEDDPSEYEGALSITGSAGASSFPRKAKRSLSHKRDSSTSSKKVRKSSPVTKHQESKGKGKKGFSLGVSLLAHDVTPGTGSEDDTDNDSDDAEQMSSEDEGFIEVTFDPTEVIEEDELFPASIFEGAEEPVPKIEMIKPKTTDFTSSSKPEQPPRRRSLRKTTTTVSNPDDRGRKMSEESVESHSEKVNDMAVESSFQDKNKKDASVVPETSDVEQRKSVLRDILSQLKRKKEEIEQLYDSGENIEVKFSEDAITQEKTEQHKDENETNEKECVSESNLTEIPINDFDSKIHHIDSESEDEDLKLAIALSLQNTKSDHENFETKTEDKGNDICNNEDKNKLDKDISDDEKNEDNDDDDFEMVGSTSEENVIKVDDEQKDKDYTTDMVEYVREQENITIQEDMVDDNDEEEDNLDDEEAAGGFVRSAEDSDDESPSKVQELSGERLQPEDFEIETPGNFLHQASSGDWTGELEAERNALLLEQGRQARFATSVTEQVTLEAQELLRLFGIPFIISPMEAEAQCAYLDLTEQTNGTITDDSDIWLFGGRRMYKNFFNQNKHVEFFSEDGIVSHFGLRRHQLINLALLCGSDYTQGIEGVGPVRALEIMGEFPGEGLDGLRDFKKWWDKAQKNPLMRETSKLRKRLSDLSVIKGFPSQAVVDAYLSPAVDESRDRFSWSEPDLDLIRQFAKLKFGWSKEKCNNSLEPMMKQLTQKKSQGRIYSYFQQDTFIPAAIAKSNRLEKALARVQGASETQDQDTLRKEEEERQPETVIKRNTNRGSSKKKEEASLEPTKETALRKRKEGAIKRVGKTGKKKAAISSKEIQKSKSSAAKGENSDKEEHIIPSTSDDSVTHHQPKDDSIGQFSTTIDSEKIRRKETRSTRKRLQHSALVPTLETKRKGKRTQIKQAVPLRSNICLSESSSDSESSEDEKPGKIARSETVEPKKSTVQNAKPPKSGNKMKSEILKTEPVNSRESESKPQMKKLKMSDPSQPDEEPVTRRTSLLSMPSKSKSKDAKENLNLKTESTNLSSGQNQRPCEKVTSNPGHRVKANTKPNSSQASTRGESGKKSNDRFGDSDASIKQKRRGVSSKHAMVDEEIADTPVTAAEINKTDFLDEFQEISSSDQNQSTNPEETEADVLPKEKAKNPDVSLINAQTLKATLTYLNQRSHEKKQLLQILKGGHRLNAIERRMQEEEKRERMDSLLQEKKAKQKTITQEEKTGDKQLVSFEDMLGGLDAEISVKSKVGKQRSRSDLGKKSQKTKTVQNKAHKDTQLKDPEKPYMPSKNRRRMRSMSDDSSSGTDLMSNQDQTKGESEKTKSQVSVKDQRSFRSQCFDAPIKIPPEEHSEQISDNSNRSDKFHYQIQHFQDKRSVKGIGYVPSYGTTERFRSMAVTGKGKGVGKNRCWCEEDDLVKQRKQEEEETFLGIQATKGVTGVQINEYAHITADDLGSDFSDSEF